MIINCNYKIQFIFNREAVRFASKQAKIKIWIFEIFSKGAARKVPSK